MNKRINGGYILRRQLAYKNNYRIHVIVSIHYGLVTPYGNIGWDNGLSDDTKTYLNKHILIGSGVPTWDLNYRKFPRYQFVKCISEYTQNYFLISQGSLNETNAHYVFLINPHSGIENFENNCFNECNLHNFGAESGIFRDNYINSVTADALAPCIAMSSPIEELNAQGN